MADDPLDIGKILQHAIEAHSRHRQSGIEGEADDRSKHVLLERFGGGGNHRVQENAKPHPVGFFEKRPVPFVRQRRAADIAQQNDAIQFQMVDGAMEFRQRRVGRIHRNRREGLEALGVFRDQIGVGVVHHSGHVGLAPGVGKEHVRRGEGDDFHIDADAIHVFDAFRDVRHRRRDAEEPGAVISDDRAARGVRRERELATGLSDLLEESRRVVVRVDVQLLRRCNRRGRLHRLGEDSDRALRRAGDADRTGRRQECSPIHFPSSKSRGTIAPADRPPPSSARTLHVEHAILGGILGSLPLRARDDIGGVIV
jgi:hypothetical protein